MPMRATAALEDLERLLGREQRLDEVHAALRRAAQGVRDVREYGTCLVTCSDEFQNELRTAFNRDVARPLLPHSDSRTFAVSNMGGRVEPGALILADNHFTVETRAGGTKLLVVEIASHVGRRQEGEQVLWGELARFGLPSPCCGALGMLIDPPVAAAGVRHPWLDQLHAFFGPRRLGELRVQPATVRMLSAAVVHAVLQSETALVDLLRSPPPTPTHALVAGIVVVNQPDSSDNAILCSVHHLISDGGTAQIVNGASLRSAPSSHRFAGGSGEMVVSSTWEGAELDAPPVEARLSPAARALAQDARVRAVLDTARRQTEQLDQRPDRWAIHGRVVLRGLVQSLSIAAPELGLELVALGRAGELDDCRPERLLSARGSQARARALLHDIEPQLQQLENGAAHAILSGFLAGCAGGAAE